MEFRSPPTRSDGRRRVVVVTFATGDYANSAEILRHSACLNGEVDAAFVYGVDSKCVRDFYAETGFSANDRGAGYWGWKPRIIADAISMLDEGDVLVYLDAATIVEANLRGRADRLLQEGGNTDVVLFSLGGYEKNGYKNGSWTHPEALSKMKATDYEREAPQVNAAVQMYRVGEYSSSFVAEYKNWCDDRDVVADKNGFANHRHDQSIIGIVAARRKAWSFAGDRKVAIARDPSQFGESDRKLNDGDEDIPWLNHHRKRFGKIPTVSVVIPTTGNEKLLEESVRSVARQTVPGVQIWITADGPKAKEGAEAVAHRWSGRANVRFLDLPENTGSGGWNGHRIYGAVPWLTNTDYVAFLDQDNFWDDDHLHSLLTAISTSDQNPRWAFSLRRIVNEDGSFACEDRCESLGLLHHTCISENDYLVDVNCYLIERSLAIRTSECWNRIARPKEGPEVDRALVRALASTAPFAVVKRSTVSYRLGGNALSVTLPFFTRGNERLSLDFSKPLLYLFLFDKNATDRYFKTRKDKSRSYALDEWQPALPRGLEERFCLANGFSNFPVIPPGANVLCVLCNPGSIPLEFLESRKDLKRIVYTVEGPNIRHAAQWRRGFLERYFDVALTYYDHLLNSAGKMKTEFCPQNCHHLDMNDPKDLELVRKNRGTDKSIVMVLERRPELKGSYEIDGKILNCLDPNRELLVKNLKNATVVGRNWSSYEGNPSLKVASTVHRDSDPKKSVDWYADHVFALIVENTDAPGYVSEKLYDAIIAGSIPLYWGNVSKRLESAVPGLRNMFIDIAGKTSSEVQAIVDSMSDQDIESMRDVIVRGRETVLRAVGQKSFADAVYSAFYRLKKP